MNKRYLGIWVDDQGTRRVASTSDPTEILNKSHGQASPLFPALPSSAPLNLATSGALLFLVPHSPSALLSRLVNDLGDVRLRSYITHGHVAAVVTLESRAECEELVAELRDEIRGYEIWVHDDGRVDGEITVLEPSEADGWTRPAPIDSTALQSEARSQVDQFNSNLAIFSRLASLYCPEVSELALAVRESVDYIVERLAEIHAGSGTEDAAVREALGLEVHLVEVNAVLSIYTSQIGSGSLPLGEDLFPVGEYSLLGIGGMCRGAWRLYAHLNKTFAEHDHAGIIQRAYPSLPSFDPFAPRGRTDFSGWDNLALHVESLSEAPEVEARQHIPYFSSRWGFHESWNAISLSWQCLYAAASKEWNLLTITHEYLHAHVRDIFGVIFNPESAGIAGVLDDFNNKRPGGNALASMRLAYIEAISSIERMTDAADRVSGTRQTISATLPNEISEEELRSLYKRHTELVHETAVHVLDFWYVYDGRDDIYVNSIWSSWSLIPSVANRVPYYVLRTLAALASTSPSGPSKEMFDHAAERLLTCLRSIDTRERPRPVVTEAIRLLEDPESRRRLGIQFAGPRFVVELTLRFFKDSRLNAALVRDTQVAVIDGHRTYNVEFGTYPGLDIESPIAFLLDRFSGYEDQAGSERVEHESIWQMLQLV